MVIPGFNLFYQNPQKSFTSFAHFYTRYRFHNNVEIVVKINASNKPGCGIDCFKCEYLKSNNFVKVLFH